MRVVSNGVTSMEQGTNIALNFKVIKHSTGLDVWNRRFDGCNSHYDLPPLKYYNIKSNFINNYWHIDAW